MTKLSDWESKTGVDFLKKVGIKKGDKVLDFGCNIGNYTIPAAIIVGEKGTVIAIDEDDFSFDTIRKKTKMVKLENIRAINTKGKLDFDFANNFFDFVMLYDVLHYLNFQSRKTFYQEIFRILKINAILSVHPKHTIGNFPMMELRNVSVDELITEIEDNGFGFKQKICGELSHDELLEDGCIINFRKKYPEKE